jgi:RimJ/RimL family protein N-acetyltransferase
MQIPRLDVLHDGDLRLRPAVDDDVAAIHRICQDPEIQRWTRVPSPYREADARQLVSLSREALATGQGLHLLAVDVTSDEVLGAVGLSVDGAELSGDLGYWVAPEARGRGVATRGGRLLCRLAFEQLRLGYVGLMAAAGNRASNEVARRLGFTLEGTRRLAMIDGPSGDPAAPRCDASIWGLLPGELR